MSQLGFGSGGEFAGLDRLLRNALFAAVATPLVARYLTGSWSSAAKWSAGVYGLAYLYLTGALNQPLPGVESDAGTSPILLRAAGLQQALEARSSERADAAVAQLRANALLQHAAREATYDTREEADAAAAQLYGRSAGQSTQGADGRWKPGAFAFMPGPANNVVDDLDFIGFGDCSRGPC